MAVTRDPIERAPVAAPATPPVDTPQAGVPATPPADTPQVGAPLPGAAHHPSPADPPTPPAAAWAGPRATALALLAIGVIALIATFAIPAGAEDPWAPSGTRFVPMAVSIGLVLLSLAFLARVTFWPDADLGAHAAREAAETEWVVPGLLAAGLIAYVVLIEPLGYVLASALFFPFGARVLGRRALVRDALAGSALAVAVYLLFTRMLGVPLSPGLLGF
jgi:putative tricarboxylic transport membrane protein